MKRVLVYFSFAQASAEQYDQVWVDLKAAGYEHPKGLLFHAGAPKGTGWTVVDVWESEDDFRAFGAVLMPIIIKTGLPLAEPTVMPIHNMLVFDEAEAVV